LLAQKQEKIMGTAPINGPGAASGLIDPNSTTPFMFSKLQLGLAEMAKSSAMHYMQELLNSQTEQKQVAALLQEARQLQAEAKSSGTSTEMPAEMVKYMDANKLAYDKTGNDTFHNNDEWDTAVISLQDRMDQVGTDTQQKMVFVQDCMGQYNSYLQGNNSVIQQANLTLAELARQR
jgi:hypothetical protein